MARPPVAVSAAHLPLPTITLFGIYIRNVTLNDAVQLIRDDLTRTVPVSVMFVHAHAINVAHADQQYRDVLARATHVFADGIGMRIASRLAGTPLRDNVNGTDLYPRLCRALEGTGTRIFLLGAEPGIVERVGARVAREAPGLNICGIHHGYLRGPQEDAGAVAAIRRARTDLLLVGMGVPRQEKWLAAHLEATGARVGIAVGGLFDVYSGKIWRPPIWMRRLGLEWLGRLVPGRGEPRRLWRRYLLGNIKFLYLAARWALTGKRTPANVGDRSARDR